MQILFRQTQPRLILYEIVCNSSISFPCLGNAYCYCAYKMTLMPPTPVKASRVTVLPSVVQEFMISKWILSYF